MAFVISDDKVEDFLKEKADKDKVKQIYKVAERFEQHHKPKPQTNADRIRSMTDEELAEWIYKHDTKTSEKGRWSKERILEYMKSEVKE